MLSSFTSNFTFEQNKLGHFYIFLISSSQSFISQILKVVSPLGKKFIFSVPWDFKYKRIMIIKPQNSSFTHSDLFSDI